uniref:OBG-type G domain-containing protein n=1 Tax=Chromera velia CCMP2878 TaxID=1169474 RepID=A0A0G4H1I1_9ALVE|mmetsp:Transcript_83/g.218  ORF Transcript_83/g.218 Transcript_83/m.218 type:complete len:370 (-) Transcript_83:137-1246(-)|eukprot:Cvel_24270.t1-p1 / transcript=Cvel_24270.t1 / gene=Cvel_24270 / organism=Chromera_velia_CCMP2878 / gene_product=Developmentally regulated G-protein 2, putative / transcript_product=Developmentally regulated G-protein 2, putative / location=Cvel_scaffold2602:17370-22206(-) / protein_length=369 / sequence_SO=supercontig / SO=protein_coding / is_pseudo=false
MGILERIKDIEEEVARTQKNKATEYHLGRLKAQLAKLKTQVLEGQKKTGGAGEGFEVQRYGDSRIALIGFPSVGKSSLLTALTGTKSEAAAYEFTTLTCIPGVIHYKDAKIQMLDLPGIIEGAAAGRGRGRQVIAVAKSADCVVIVLDATKDDSQKEKLEAELEAVGIRLNRRPPDIYFKPKKGGGLNFNSIVPLTKVDQKAVQTVLHEYKIFNVDVVFREDASIDDFIDVIEGNRKYVKCLYVYNKVDLLSIKQVDEIARRPNSVVVSCHGDLNLETLKERLWEYLGMVRVYTKKKGEFPDFSEPIILTEQRGEMTIGNAVRMIHRDLLKDFKYGLVWGKSAKHNPQRVGTGHNLEDEDVLQIVKKGG